MNEEKIFEEKLNQLFILDRQLEETPSPFFMARVVREVEAELQRPSFLQKVRNFLSQWSGMGITAGLAIAGGVYFSAPMISKLLKNTNTVHERIELFPLGTPTAVMIDISSVLPFHPRTAQVHLSNGLSAISPSHPDLVENKKDFKLYLAQPPQATFPIIILANDASPQQIAVDILGQDDVKLTTVKVELEVQSPK